MNSKKHRPIKVGDPRTFFESKTTESFTFPNGLNYPEGSIVRSATHIKIDNQEISFTMPSMSELIFFQARKDLEKASSIKKRALRYITTNGHLTILDEELLFVYFQLSCLGILGLYSSMEAMVHELHARRRNTKVIVDGKELDLSKLSSSVGFERKLTSIASQLSGKDNIHGSELMSKAQEIARLRTNLQHWDQSVDEKYFVELPNDHPLKKLLEIDPSILALNARAILDHYSLV